VSERHPGTVLAGIPAVEGNPGLPEEDTAEADTAAAVQGRAVGGNPVEGGDNPAALGRAGADRQIADQGRAVRIAAVVHTPTLRTEDRQTLTLRS